MKYFAVYKCHLCGKLSRLGDSVEVPYDELPVLLGNVIKSQSFAGSPYLPQAPMHLPCKCADGNAGLAQFVGFVKDTSVEDKRASNFLNKLIGR